MVGNWQGPASFEAVLKEAAIRAEAQNNRAAEIKKKRSDELQQLAAQIDDRLDGRRNRSEKTIEIESCNDLIVDLFEQGMTDEQISESITDQTPFYFDAAYIKRYRWKQGLIKREDQRGKVFAEHKEFILERSEKGDSIRQIQIQLKKVFDLDLSPVMIGNIIKRGKSNVS